MLRNRFFGLKILDFAIVVLVLSFGIFLSIRFFFSPRSSSGVVSVRAQEREYEFDLRDNGLHEVEGSLGKTVFEVRNGKIRIVESPCPNKTCVAQGFSDSIVCLPNRVSVRVVYGKDSESEKKFGEEFDAISR